MTTEKTPMFPGPEVDNSDVEVPGGTLPPDEPRITGFYMPNSRNSMENIEAWARELSHIFADAVHRPTAISGIDAYTGALIDWEPLPQEDVDLINELVFAFIKQSAPFTLPSPEEAEEFTPKTGE